jgi:hypothetical protein
MFLADVHQNPGLPLKRYYTGRFVRARYGPAGRRLYRTALQELKWGAAITIRGGRAYPASRDRFASWLKWLYEYLLAETPDGKPAGT